MSQIDRVAFAARIFTLAALTSLAAVAGARFLPGALLVAVVALAAVGVSLLERVSQTWVAVFEGSTVAVVATLTFPDQAAVTPYLVIPALIGALDSGRGGVLRVVGTEFSVLALSWWLLQGGLDREMAASGFTWLATSAGLGLLGVSWRTALARSASDAPYRTALSLIRRLRSVSERMRGGLDAVDVAERVMETADERLGARHAGVFVHDGRSVVPLRYSWGTDHRSMEWAQEAAEVVWRGGRPAVDEHRVLLPLDVDGETVALLAVEGHGPMPADILEGLEGELTTAALQLQASLLFGRVRDAATRRERQRIAREVHDGVAQDVASLGYLVDNLTASAGDDAQREQLAQLRQEISRVVHELRHSIFELRQVAATGAGLGESLAAYARHVGSTSPLTVHVTLDEQGPRLPAEIEHELLRIAQQAMSNSRKHSGAGNLWLSCTVQAPYAEIEIRDDGVRPHAPQPDSQGLRIMHERAESIGADLTVEEPGPERIGTRVRVRLGAESR